MVPDLRNRGFRLLLVCAALLTLLWGSGLNQALPPSAGTDRAFPEELDLSVAQKLLEQAGVPTDGAGLLAFLRRPKAKDLSEGHVKELIRELGDDRFTARERAATELVELGAAAVALLQQAVTGSEPERVTRAQACLEKIEQASSSGVVKAVVDLVVHHRPPGTVGALLHYLPVAPSESLAEEIWYGLEAVTSRVDKLEAAVEAAFGDPVPGRRAAAGFLLARHGSPPQRRQAAGALRDPDPEVRLRVAQGFLSTKDRRAIPALIDLLAEASTPVAWQAEELLHCLAGEPAPDRVVGAGGPREQQLCRERWRKWWERVGRDMDLSRPGAFQGRPGLVLLCQLDDDPVSPLESRQGRVVLCGCEGSPRWQLTGLPGPSDAQLLADGRMLVAEPQKLVEYELTGVAVRAYPVSAQGFGFLRQPTGWTYLGGMPHVVAGKVSIAGKDLFCRPLRVEVDQNGLRSEYTGRGRILPNGYIQLEGSPLENDKPGFLQEIDPATGARCAWVRIERSLGLWIQRGGVGIDRNILFARRGEVIELNRAGQRVGRYAVPGPSADYGIKLRNGCILVTQGSHPWVAVEWDRGGRVKWEFVSASGTHAARDCFPLLRLGFGDLPAPDWDLDSVPNRVKALKRQEKVVRIHALVALARHGRDAGPAVPALIDAFDDPDEEVRRYVPEAIRVAGPGALPELRRRLKDPRVNVRRGAISCFAYFGAEADDYLADLIERVGDREWQARAAAANALGSFRGHPSAVIPPLIRALRDASPEVRKEAALSVGAFGPAAKEAVPTVVSLLDGNDEGARNCAVAALGDIGGAASAAVPRLIRAFQETRSLDYKTRIARTLGQIGPAARGAFPILVELLMSNDEDSRESAAEALLRIGPATEVVKSVLDRLKTEAGEDKRLLLIAVLNAMGRDARDAVPTLRELVQKEPQSSRVGQAAQRAIQNILRLP